MWEDDKNGGFKVIWRSKQLGARKKKPEFKLSINFLYLDLVN
jgi:hypothetical protein